MIGAKAVVEMLLAYGVEVVSGVPGDASLPLYYAHTARFIDCHDS